MGLSPPTHTHPIEFMLDPLPATATKVPRKTRGELAKNVDADYYGYRDEEDGIIVALEQEEEKRGVYTVHCYILVPWYHFGVAGGPWYYLYLVSPWCCCTWYHLRVLSEGGRPGYAQRK